MFNHASTLLFLVVALAGLATAAPNGGNSQCNTGSIQCCTSTQSSSSIFINDLFGFMGIPLPTSGSQVGFTCSPITTGGLGSGSTCTSQPVCCNGNSFNGVIVTGCNPTTINL